MHELHVPHCFRLNHEIGFKQSSKLFFQWRIRDFLKGGFIILLRSEVLEATPTSAENHAHFDLFSFREATSPIDPFSIFLLKHAKVSHSSFFSRVAREGGGVPLLHSAYH